MSVTVLVCPCGLRLKAAGMVPGKSGRCPRCGGLIRMPGRVPPSPSPSPSPAAAAPVDEDEWNWQGIYELDPVDPGPATPRVEPGDDCRPEGLEGPETPATASPSDAATVDDEWSWTGTGYELGADDPAPSPGPDQAQRAVERPEIAPDAVSLSRAPKQGGGPRAPAVPEPWWPPRVLYPLRGAEGVAMVVALGTAFWVMATLVPEYCLALQADAEMLGTPSMGRLIAVISGLPTLILFPMALGYWLQYLGRVLAAGSEGETRPPRPPDRNRDGLLDGLGTWLLWLVLGGAAGLLPLAAYWAAASGDASWDPRVAVVLGLLGLPYVLMALLLTFLDEDPLAARPGAVLGAITRVGPSFLGLCLSTAATLGIALGAFAAAWPLRAGHFRLFVLASLACWLVAAWASIVAMHGLGSYYGLRKDRLKSRQERPRRGAR